MGKRTLNWVESDQIVVRVKNTRTGKTAELRLTPALMELLGAFKDCPAAHRLLILNLVPAPEDPLFAPPAADLSAAVFKALEEVPDAGRHFVAITLATR